jgi:hypothetical protein
MIADNPCIGEKWEQGFTWNHYATVKEWELEHTSSKNQQVFYTSEKLFGIHDPAKMPDRALFIANRGLPTKTNEDQGQI